MTITADTISDFQVCVDCGQILPRTDFHKDSSKFDGLKRRCKTCRRDYMRANPDVGRKAAQKYRRDHSEIYKSKVQQYKNDNPERRRAVYTLDNAVRDRRVIRPNKCSVCNKPCKPDGHHEDYSLPLAVMWVCRSCHITYHKKRRIA